jgi:hypothetical protein
MAVSWRPLKALQYYYHQQHPKHIDTLKSRTPKQKAPGCKSPCKEPTDRIDPVSTASKSFIHAYPQPACASSQRPRPQLKTWSAAQYTTPANGNEFLRCELKFINNIPRFTLSKSSNPMTQPTVAASIVGRLAINSPAWS